MPGGATDATAVHHGPYHRLVEGSPAARAALLAKRNRGRGRTVAQEGDGPDLAEIDAQPAAAASRRAHLVGRFTFFPTRDTDGVVRAAACTGVAALAAKRIEVGNNRKRRRLVGRREWYRRAIVGGSMMDTAREPAQQRAPPDVEGPGVPERAMPVPEREALERKGGDAACPQEMGQPHKSRFQPFTVHRPRAVPTRGIGHQKTARAAGVKPSEFPQAEGVQTGDATAHVAPRSRPAAGQGDGVAVPVGEQRRTGYVDRPFGTGRHAPSAAVTAVRVDSQNGVLQHPGVPGTDVDAGSAGSGRPTGVYATPAVQRRRGVPRVRRTSHR